MKQSCTFSSLTMLIFFSKNGAFQFTSFRLSGAGVSVKDKDMEEKLFNWIKETRGRKLRVSRRMVTNKARELSNGNHKVSFVHFRN